ncbi:MAG TPA: class I SAM-dependent methyltransferase, partial [Gemmatimonadaceae bacterium]|nr:class I SAM-dependent methyltransferase [Gemmatimonadaceae bacterium]
SHDDRSHGGGGHGHKGHGSDAGYAREVSGAHEHGGHKQHGKHGNPEDLKDYVARMENPERAEWQKPDEVIAALKVKPDDVVCDIGGGPGYFSLRFAKQARHVYAVDVEPRMLEALRERIRERGATNVTPVFALEADPLIPRAGCDLIVVVDTYHHFPDGVAYLRRLAESLKPGGRLVNIDFHKRELPVGPKIDHLIAREAFIADAEKAGLKVTAEETFLPYQYFLVMQPKR